MLREVIIFGFTAVGVEVNSHCNLLSGVHVWNNLRGPNIGGQCPYVLTAHRAPAQPPSKHIETMHKCALSFDRLGLSAHNVVRWIVREKARFMDMRFVYPS